ncbi:MAG: hypothetical protein HC800_06665 [Phormidesmis sp. RL_2_1]|nr:hypothetical protein [Phormidesmis sp. RL_2_1]
MKSNPFETYRNPATGRWEVKYPDVRYPADHSRAVPAAISENAIAPAATEERVNPFCWEEASLMPPRRHWKKASRIKKVVA